MTCKGSNDTARKTPTGIHINSFGESEGGDIKKYCDDFIIDHFLATRVGHWTGAGLAHVTFRTIVPGIDRRSCGVVCYVRSVTLPVLLHAHATVHDGMYHPGRCISHPGSGYLNTRNPKVTARFYHLGTLHTTPPTLHTTPPTLHTTPPAVSCLVVELTPPRYLLPPKRRAGVATPSLPVVCAQFSILHLVPDQHDPMPSPYPNSSPSGDSRSAGGSRARLRSVLVVWQSFVSTVIVPPFIAPPRVPGGEPKNND